MIDLNEARDVLKDEVSIEAFDDIVTQRVLGASKHIHMIGEMIESIALNGREKQLSTDIVVDNIITLSTFFIETRGNESQAVSNAINIMIRKIDDVRNLNVTEAVESIIQKKNSYAEKAQEDTKNVIKYSTEIASSMKSIMVFDYSSTVNDFLKNLKNATEDLRVFIPESRVIDGGYPFVKTCQDAGHTVHFIPDCSIMYYLKQCDGAFIGAETILPDGTTYNTTGSDIVGLVCKEYRIPLYVLTPLIKIDVRSLYGYSKELKINNLEDRLGINWETSEKEKIIFQCPELLGVDPEHITAIITEQGIIPANQFLNVSINFYNHLKGE
ncbi:hypothetical protein [Pseudogracilibacillus sp. SO30301A]|uniref:hypothetical protein n=1 Tax=Pseudogracilibacillus sp. SO30301A TaxID=3098291 RepID=UPI00300E49A5